MPGPAPREIPDDMKRRLAEVRAQAAARRDELALDGPEDPIERVAWVAGLIDVTPADLASVIEAARAERVQWRELAEAVGDGDSPEAAARLSQRFASWRR